MKTLAIVTLSTCAGFAGGILATRIAPAPRPPVQYLTRFESLEANRIYIGNEASNCELTNDGLRCNRDDRKVEVTTAPLSVSVRQGAHESDLSRFACAPTTARLD